MNHDEAAQAAARALCCKGRRDTGCNVVNCPAMKRLPDATAAVRAYLAAFGVRDLGLLVDAAKCAVGVLEIEGRDAERAAIYAAMPVDGWGDFMSEPERAARVAALTPSQPS